MPPRSGEFSARTSSAYARRIRRNCAGTRGLPADTGRIQPLYQQVRCVPARSGDADAPGGPRPARYSTTRRRATALSATGASCQHRAPCHCSPTMALLPWGCRATPRFPQTRILSILIWAPAVPSARIWRTDPSSAGCSRRRRFATWRAPLVLSQRGVSYARGGGGLLCHSRHEPGALVPLGAGGKVRKFNDLPPRYRGNVNSEPPLNRSPGRHLRCQSRTLRTSSLSWARSPMVSSLRSEHLQRPRAAPAQATVP